MGGEECVESLFGPIMNSSESHVFGIQKLTNEITVDEGVAESSQTIFHSAQVQGRKK